MPKAILISTALLLASSAASAEVPCGKRDKIIDWLAAKYQEEPVASGISSKGALLEVLSSEDGDTWTILLTAPNGTTCVVDTGQAWQPKPHEFEVAEPQV
jgi:hypothetical protein